VVGAVTNMSQQKRSALVGCILLLAFLVYANTVTNGFVYDDHSQIEQNPYVHSFDYLGKIFGTPVLSYQGIQGAPNYYRPLMMFAFLIEYHLFGVVPYGYHLINIILHCIVVWLVYELSAELTSDAGLGLIAAFIFALYPAHTESVAWVAGLTDIELTVFYLLTFWLFLRQGKERGHSLIWLRCAMLLSFAFALLSKEQAVTLPVLAFFYEHFYRSDRQQTKIGKKIARYAGLWLTTLAYFVVRALAVGALGPVLQHKEITRGETFLTAFALFGQYVRKLLWPTPLIAFYPFQKSASIADGAVVFGLLASLISIVVFVLLWKRARIYSFAVLWTFLCLAPVLDARWMAVNVFAERYLYLPSVAFFLSFAGVIVWLWRKSTRWQHATRSLLVAACAALALVGAHNTVARNRDWKDDRTLILQTLSVRPDSANMRCDLGLMNWREGDHAEAERQWHLALTYRPDTPEALSDLGYAMLEEKRYNEALAYLNRVIELKPRFATPHIHRARVYAALGQSAQAEAEFRQALEIYPMNPATRNALGQFYLSQGRVSDAKEQFLTVIKIMPDVEAWSGLGQVYDDESAYEKGEDAWRHVLAFEQFSQRAHLSLGRIYLAKGRVADAQREFQACLLMDPNDAEAVAGLRKISASAGASAPAGSKTEVK
jgi:protein O-mannosyl-transferase